MCFSAPVSFGVAGALILGGVLTVQKARAAGPHYTMLAFFPLIVGTQQAIEGVVWLALLSDHPILLRLAALLYLFFVWMIWPLWVPSMTARLEPPGKKKTIFRYCALAGFLFGTMIYLPNFWNANWLYTHIVDRSISYDCVVITDHFLPRLVPVTIYLSLIGLPPLFSSHRTLRIFGAGLILSVPLTFAFFEYVHISMLCFFAALMTFYVLWMIPAPEIKKSDETFHL